MDTELKQNLARIIRTLEGQGMKPNKIAQAIGYAATRQLDNTIEGKSNLSIKAVRGLINNLKVNPIYLFLGKEDMFLADETEIETLRRENREWIQRHNEVVKTVMSLYEIIKKLEKRNADLIDLSSAALKNSQGQKQEENDLKKPENENFDFLKWMDEESTKKILGISYFKDPILANTQYLRLLKDLEKNSNKEEPESPTKQDEK
jgi:hypothetical protein